VSFRQLGDTDKAAEYYDTVIELDTGNDKALNEAIEVREQKQDWDAVERLYRTDLERATEVNDTARMITTMGKLAALYHDKLDNVTDATRRVRTSHHSARISCASFEPRRSPAADASRRG
jgi:hypothetical protein